jgi:hypothetical protein
MFFFWFIPVLIFVVIAVWWFVKRVEDTSPARSDSDLITTDQAVNEELREKLNSSEPAEASSR